MNSVITSNSKRKNSMLPLREKAHAGPKPYVTNNSGNNEWYTPEKYIEMARRVLKNIDLDPASCAYANKTVKATQYFSIEDDGLQHTWNGNVWMNPPYGSKLIGMFADKFATEFRNGHIREGIVLVNNTTDSKWFRQLAKEASAIVFPTSRIKFNSSTRESYRPLQGQAFLYFGMRKEAFMREFSAIGIVCSVDHQNN